MESQGGNQMLPNTAVPKIDRSQFRTPPANLASNYKLSPSDFAFLWEDCKRCFYQKVVHGVAQPRTPMPKIFIQIDSFQKAYTPGKRMETLAPNAPPGVISFGGKSVESVLISIRGRASSCFIRGNFDTV